MKVILKPGGLVVLLVLTVAGGIGLTKLRPTPESADKNLPSTKSSKELATPVTSAQKPLTGASLIDPTRQGWNLIVQKPALGTMKLQISPDLPVGQQHSLHLEVTAIDPNKYWCAQLLKTVPQAVEGNHNLTVQFWGRSAKKTAVYIVFEEGVSPHTAEFQKQVRFTPEWRQYQFPFRTTKDHTDVHATFCVKAGIEPGEIEIANMHVTDNGPAK
ncbi:hypothetical protein [Armatimonas sp.]|uniref:hypothetical protein n=1 Tax=Armatimonas sp. TaxID=1872638 RepID=UPI003752E665